MEATNTDAAKKLKLPNGEQMQIKVPPSPERNPKEYVKRKCKFNIELSILRQKLDADIWPNPEVLKQELGTNSISEANLWTGTKEDWVKLLREENKTSQEKRVSRLKAIRSCQRAFQKLTPEDWQAITGLFRIQRGLI